MASGFVLGGFRRGDINVRYVERQDENNLVQGHHTFWSSSGDIFMYYTRGRWWLAGADDFESARAGKPCFPIARSPADGDPSGQNLGRGWDEWDGRGWHFVAGAGVGGSDEAGAAGSALDMAAVWEEYSSSARFFSSLELATDGGFSEVQELFTENKILQALVTLGSLSLNMYLLVFRNLQILLSTAYDLKIEDAACDRSVWQEQLLINHFSSAVFNRMFSPDVILAFCELCVFAVMALKCVQLIWRAATEGEVKRWHAVSSLLLGVLPKLMTISGLRVLHHVTPSIVVTQLLNLVKNAVTVEPGCGLGVSVRVWPLLRFFVLRIGAGVVGYEVFLIKFMSAAALAQDAKDSMLVALYSLAFLNQMLGIVQVSHLLSKRLFLFIFGGEDCFMNRREALVAKTWVAMLTKEVWVTSKTLRNSLGWFLAVMLSYSDADFQKLTLNEHRHASSV